MNSFTQFTSAPNKNRWKFITSVTVILIAQSIDAFAGESMQALGTELIQRDNRDQICKKLPSKEICEERHTILFTQPPLGSVQNRNGQLTITLKNGTTKISWNDNGRCKDRAIPEGECDSFTVLFDQTHEYFWVLGQHYESGSTELISYATGKSVRVEEHSDSASYLEVSPDGNHVLISEQSEDGGVSLKLYSFTKNEIVQLAEFDGINSGAFWINSSEIGIFHFLNDGAASIDARIKKQGNKWMLINENGRRKTH